MFFICKASEIDKEQMRGIIVFVLNQRTGALMAVRAFDTYASKDEGQEIIKFIEILQEGRIVCLAIKVKYSRLSPEEQKYLMYTFVIVAPRKLVPSIFQR